MKLIDTLRNLLNSNFSSTRKSASPQGTQATDERSVEVMQVAGSRAPRPNRVRRQGNIGRNA